MGTGGMIAAPRMSTDNPGIVTIHARVGYSLMYQASPNILSPARAGSRTTSPSAMEAWDHSERLNSLTSQAMIDRRDHHGEWPRPVAKKTNAVS